MKRRVELIYDSDCPNAQPAREVLRAAFERLGLEPSWTEWERSSPDTPRRMRAYGSPTILVGGLDIAGQGQGDGHDCCRLYSDASGRLSGVPPLEAIIRALGGTREGEEK